MNLADYFISCDWGTSNFRLRLVQKEDLHVLKEISSDIGVKKLFTDFQKQMQGDQFAFFSKYLITQLEKIQLPPQKITIVASGMISSTIGMKELPYAPLPFSTNGKGLNFQKEQLTDLIDIVIISGVCNENDVMRGEEIQAIGLSDALLKLEEGVLILPGTHSKHISYKKHNLHQGNLIDFHTYMTGEVFQIILQNSILQSSLKDIKWHIDYQSSFLKGVVEGLRKELLRNLFSIRVEHLFKKATPEENYFYLSGLLIGNEISYLKDGHQTVVLAASGPLLNLYKIALDVIIHPDRLLCISEQDFSKALLFGQRVILSRC